MSDEIENKPVKAVYEPGTLDHTRQNIGLLDKEEAARMTKVLGGQVFTEKSVPIDYSKLPKRAITHRQRATGSTSASISSDTSSSAITKSASTNSSQPKANAKKTLDLPNISSKDAQLIDRIMMSTEYGIKKNYGIFNFVRYFQKDGAERVIPEFAKLTLSNHLTHLEGFLTVIKTIIQLSPDTYKAKIANDQALKFRFLRKVATWTTRDIKLSYIDLDNKSDQLIVSDLIPFVKNIYKLLITVYYLSEATVSATIKEIYNDLIHYPKADQKTLSGLAKSGITEWLYIYVQIIKGLYPLLMRMCGTSFNTFSNFFVAEMPSILNFVGLKKFDLLLPERNKEKQANDEKAKAKKEETVVPQEDPHRKDEIVSMGLKLLDRLFPQAGFLQIEKMPDMYPYFTNLYDFSDGFELLSNQNPIQMIGILNRILEDIFLGCHNIHFTLSENPIFKTPTDSITLAMEDWALYREKLFDKKYLEPLTTLVNQTYTQKDFGSTQIGKKIINGLHWETKYNFLPQFTFERLVLERPINDNKLISLYGRISFLRDVFTKLLKQVSSAEKTHGEIKGISNMWEAYKFDIQTPVSKRLDVLLHAKVHGDAATATNANLIKYTACIVSVLDWWVNAKESPAYHCDPRKLYRVSDSSGEPIFSVKPTEDPNKLFAESIRKPATAHTTVATGGGLAPSANKTATQDRVANTISENVKK